MKYIFNVKSYLYCQLGKNYLKINYRSESNEEFEPISNDKILFLLKNLIFETNLFANVPSKTILTVYNLMPNA
jgi:hypothetical protein